jgi:K+-sensing histidine kinase KdpD
MPLNSALAFNHVLSTKFSNNKQACEILKMQKNGCLFMVSLIEDILDFARIQYDKFDLILSWFTIGEIITEV